jgi:hypothetical protein
MISASADPLIVWTVLIRRQSIINVNYCNEGLMTTKGVLVSGH